MSWPRLVDADLLRLRWLRWSRGRPRSRDGNARPLVITEISHDRTSMVRGGAGSRPGPTRKRTLAQRSPLLRRGFPLAGAVLPLGHRADGEPVAGATSQVLVPPLGGSHTRERDMRLSQQFSNGAHAMSTIIGLDAPLDRSSRRDSTFDELGTPKASRHRPQSLSKHGCRELGRRSGEVITVLTDTF